MREKAMFLIKITVAIPIHTRHFLKFVLVKYNVSSGNNNLILSLSKYLTRKMYAHGDWLAFYNTFEYE